MGLKALALVVIALVVSADAWDANHDTIAEGKRFVVPIALCAARAGACQSRTWNLRNLALGRRPFLRAYPCLAQFFIMVSAR